MEKQNFINLHQAFSSLKSLEQKQQNANIFSNTLQQDLSTIKWNSLHYSTLQQMPRTPPSTVPKLFDIARIPHDNHLLNQPDYNPLMQQPTECTNQELVNPTINLINYCCSKKYPLRIANVEKCGTYECSVHIDGVIYSSYPSICYTPCLAQKLAAIKALENIKMEYYMNQSPEMENPLDDLEDYCRSKKYQLPQIHVRNGKFAPEAVAWSVVVNGTTYNSFHEYETPYLAKNACAKKVLQYLKMQERKKPLTDEIHLVLELYTELLKHPQGFLVKHLSNFFATKFNQRLTEKCLKLIQNSSLFTIRSETSYNTRIYASKGRKNSSPLAPEEIRNPIRLPWSYEWWNILITHCTSTVEVWGRLLHAENSVRFDILMADIKAYMETKKECPAESIARKTIYLVNIKECWHRVRVEEIDKSTELVRCFFIDSGREEWFTEAELYICEKHFLRLPSQAVPISLVGLEDFEQHPDAATILDYYLTKNAYYARIFANVNDVNSMRHGKIPALLFGTFYDDEEYGNLNDCLIKIICSETAVPTIKKRTVTKVIVTHIEDDGDYFYVQVKKPELEYVQNLLHKVAESKLKRDQHKITLDDIIFSNLFLICDDDDSTGIKWYRACFSDRNIRLHGDNYWMYCVDYGTTKSINISNIFSLDILSTALSKFPAQAIKVQFDLMQDMTPDDLQYIRKDCEISVILSESGRVPLLQICSKHKYLQMDTAVQCNA